MLNTFTAIPHNDLLHFLCQLAILLAVSRLLGSLALRFNQPSIFGEITAGIILGPSMLGAMFDTVNFFVLPQSPIQSQLLEIVSLMGVMLLLLLTGLEIDFKVIKNNIRSAGGASIGGLAIPLICGYILGQNLPSDMMGKLENPVILSMFLAVAMSISAIPVIAKVLMELQLTRRTLGQSIVAAAMIDDAAGWILLSIILALAGGAAITVGTIAKAVFSVLGFIAVSLFIGRKIIKFLFEKSLSLSSNSDSSLTLVLILMLAWGALAQTLHLEAMLGAFIFGVTLGTLPKLNTQIIEILEKVALKVLVPIFFCITGLKVNVLALSEPRLIGLLFVVLSCAIGCKIIGVYIGARGLGKLDHWSALFLAFGLNARGSIEILLANIGLSIGIISQPLFSVIVVMALFTSLIAPVALRYCFNRIQSDEEELSRLKREKHESESFILNVRKVLLPIRYQPIESRYDIDILEAKLLKKISNNQPLLITLLCVIDPKDTTGLKKEESHEKVQEFLDQIARVFQDHKVNKKIIVSEKPGREILNEASKNYDLVIIGATTHKPNASCVFSPVIDNILRNSPCSVILVKALTKASANEAKRILVPTNGSLASRRAAELGFSIASTKDEQVIMLKVIEANKSQDITDRHVGYGNHIMEELIDLGGSLGVDTSGEVKVSDKSAESEIIDEAVKRDVDLIILGADIRQKSRILYLGPTVEKILSESPCPVIVLNG
jgi:Kef-type K+ transport system membrane component KefB/nucleotide-binding universal stress UspA family protein